MQFPGALMDRSVVLLLGVSVGAMIGFSFAGRPASVGTAAPQPVVSAPVQKVAAVAPEVAGAEQCAAPAQRQLIETIRSGRPVRVAVFGDSYGDGVWSGLQRQLKAKDGYEVIQYSERASGFTRYRQMNLESHAAEQLGTSAIDVAVISFGANDTQAINTDTGEHAPLLGDKWKAQIGARLERYVGLLRKHHAFVYWVGLPRMREAGFDADVGAVNAFYAAEMAKLGVPFIDTRPLASDAKGEYSAYLPDPQTGERTQVRVGDGIHMSMTGYVWITHGLADRIKGYVEATRAVATDKGK